MKKPTKEQIAEIAPKVDICQEIARKHLIDIVNDLHDEDISNNAYVMTTLGLMLMMTLSFKHKETKDLEKVRQDIDSLKTVILNTLSKKGYK